MSVPTERERAIKGLAEKLLTKLSAITALPVSQHADHIADATLEAATALYDSGHKAGRDEGLEQAAKMAEGWPILTNICASTIRDIAAAIRALRQEGR